MQSQLFPAVIAGLSLLAGLGRMQAAALGNGIKIGEVTATSALVWTRITAEADFRTDGLAFQPEDDAVPAGQTLNEMRYSLPGAAGAVRVTHWPANRADDKIHGDWVPVRADRDHAVQIELDALTPGTTYAVAVHIRTPSRPDPVIGYHGRFRTAPSETADAAINFTVVTCHDFIRRDDGDRGHLIYAAMGHLDPDFMVHAGDVEYYDKPGPWAPSVELARYKWNRLFALPLQRKFYGSTAVYFAKDDHDILKNDAWPGQTYGELTWDQGLAIFEEQTPSGLRPYRTIRWGQHLQIWLTEGREYRSANDRPDGPDKSIWGAVQKAWFFKTFAESEATFRVLISPNPVLGPDRLNKNDNHANAGFAHEGREIRDFLATQENAFVICGDRHWQYASVDPVRGIREYGCGPGSDSHAGGWSMDQRTAAQTFLRIAGGFLHVTIATDERGPRARIQHRAVTGEVVNEEVLVAGLPFSGD